MTCRVQAKPTTRVPSYVQIWRQRIREGSATIQQARVWLIGHGMLAGKVDEFLSPLD